MHYAGTTEQGENVEFEVSDGLVSDVRSFLVNVMCLEAGGSHTSSLESQPFQPPGAFEIDGDGNFAGEEEVEGTTYTVTGALEGSSASGTFELSYSKITFDPFTNKSGQILCSKTVAWTAESAE